MRVALFPELKSWIVMEKEKASWVKALITLCFLAGYNVANCLKLLLPCSLP